MHGFAVLLSVSLQRGISLQEIVETLEAQGFDADRQPSEGQSLLCSIVAELRTHVPSECERCKRSERPKQIWVEGGTHGTWIPCPDCNPPARSVIVPPQGSTVVEVDTTQAEIRMMEEARDAGQS